MKTGSAGDGPRRIKNGGAPLADSRYDFPRAALRKSYIVATTPRAGGAVLCAHLWGTGALGAPCEYLAYPGGRLCAGLARRLHPSSHADYLAKIIAHRTSRNGVFGAKARFKDFQRTLEKIPDALSVLSPLRYIYVERRDRLAHAADVARAMLAARRASAPGRRAAPLRYDRDLISKCLGLLERERLAWTRWFESRGVVPLIVTYEDFAADKTGVVRRILEFLGVRDDGTAKPRHPARLRLRANRVGQRWAARFDREIREGVRRPARQPQTRGRPRTIAGAAGPDIERN